MDFNKVWYAVESDFERRITAIREVDPNTAITDENYNEKEYFFEKEIKTIFDSGKYQNVDIRDITFYEWDVVNAHYDMRYLIKRIFKDGIA